MTDGKGGDIAVGMITIDRSPGPNYLRETLVNLARAGVWDSPRLASFTLCDSGEGASWGGSEMKNAAAEAGMLLPGNTPSGSPQAHMGRVVAGPRCASLNVAEALEQAAASPGAEWVLFLEDDIDVCADFLCSVGTWLDLHEAADRHVYPFGASGGRRKGTSFDYPIEAFYGTQAFAVRPTAALSLAAWLRADPYAQTKAGTCYDLIMHHWAMYTWPDVDQFLATVPSFVQHIGSESAINPRPNVHRFISWPGREWRYAPQPDRQEQAG